MKPIPHTCEQIIDALPHGSGIDSAWTVEQDAQHRKVFGCSYHNMNGVGYYNGWSDFRVTIYQHRKDVLNPLKGPRAGQIQIVRRAGDVDFRITGRMTQDLREYLEETIQYALSEAGIVAGIGIEIVDA